jgi:phosphoglycolate phosphatase-like HAD superfamily hydrolase
MDLFDSFDNLSNEDNKWVTFKSELKGLTGKQSDIKIALMNGEVPRALAFFDIDGTLAHLDKVHGRAIIKLFPEEDPKDLEVTYFKGFKLGNSFREFDRMKGIYIDGHQEWKDVEVYFKKRFLPHQRDIDEPGGKAHRIAAVMLREYGEVASLVVEDLYAKEPREFETLSIQPIFLLARMYARMGIPMVGFTANARILVEKLVKYLKLADIFLDGSRLA